MKVQKRTQLLMPMLVVSMMGCAGRLAAPETREAQASGQRSPGFSPTPAVVVPPGALIGANNGKPPAPLPQLAKDASPETSAEYHFSLAQAYVAEGNPDRAIEEFKLVLMYDPHSSLVYARLASEYIKKGMLSAAMEACKEALQRDPKFIDARLILAGLYSATRENASAMLEYDEILKSDPTHEEAAVYKSQLLVEDGKAAEAAQQLRKFVKISKDSHVAWFYLGKAEQRIEHWQPAVAAFKKALDIKPGFSQAALALGYLYESRKQNTEALAIYQELYDASQDSGAANRIATIYLKEEKYQKAVPYLEAVESQDPEDMNVRVKLGLVRMELKDYTHAIQTFQTILEKNPDSDRIRYYLGSLYEETHQFDMAIDQLKKITAESKLYSDSALHVSFLLKQQNHVDEAKAFISDAIKKSPRVPGFYLFQASLEEESKKIDNAIAILETAQKEFPEEEKLLYYLGSLYDRQGKPDQSLVLMERILRINAQNVDALNYIGYTWTQQGRRLEDAEKLLRKAMMLRPNNAYITDSWGWHLFVRGRMKEAVVELERAVKLKPNEPTIIEHLADVYLRNNLRDKAYVRYVDAIRMTDDQEARQKLQFKLENLRGEFAKSGRQPPEISGGERFPASTQ